MTTRGRDLLVGFLYLLLIIGAVLLLVDVFNGGIEWFFPGGLVPLVLLALALLALLWLRWLSPVLLIVGILVLALLDQQNVSGFNHVWLPWDDMEDGTSTSFVCEFSNDELERIEDVTMGLVSPNDVRNLDEESCEGIRNQLNQSSTDDATEEPEAEKATATQEPRETVEPETATTQESTTRQQSSTTCSLDGINMMNQTQSGGQHRVEVGGGNDQVIVYYTQPGQTKVTYIIGPQEVPVIWYGYGQMWEERECSDLVSWARNESQREMANDHSGITYDLRSGTIYNDGNLSDEEVQDLLDEQEVTINGN